MCRVGGGTGSKKARQGRQMTGANQRAHLRWTRDGGVWTRSSDQLQRRIYSFYCVSHSLRLCGRQLAVCPVHSSSLWPCLRCPNIFAFARSRGLPSLVPATELDLLANRVAGHQPAEPTTYSSLFAGRNQPCSHNAPPSPDKRIAFGQSSSSSCF